jgi:hypothetical protein
MSDEHMPLLGGIQLRLAATGMRSSREQRLNVAGVKDIATLVLFYLNTLRRTDQRRVIHRALVVLDRPWSVSAWTLGDRVCRVTVHGRVCVWCALGRPPLRRPTGELRLSGSWNPVCYWPG